MRTLVIALLASALAACSTAPPPASSAEAEAEIQRLLAGKVAGQPVTCLAHYRTDRMIVVDDDTILFRDGSTVYRNELRSECSGLSTGFYTLITDTPGPTGLCSGEIARVAQLSSGVTVGSCVLGEFVPYRAP